MVGIFYRGMMDRKILREILKNITLVGQLGLSFIMPVLLCVGLCWFLTDRFGVGAWIYILGFVFGLGASFMTAYKFYLSVVAKEEKEAEKNKKVSFNRH